MVGLGHQSDKHLPLFPTKSSLETPYDHTSLLCFFRIARFLDDQAIRRHQFRFKLRILQFQELEYVGTALLPSPLPLEYEDVPVLPFHFSGRHNEKPFCRQDPELPD